MPQGFIAVNSLSSQAGMMNGVPVLTQSMPAGAQVIQGIPIAGTHPQLSGAGQLQGSHDLGGQQVVHLAPVGYQATMDGAQLLPQGFW